MYLMSYLDITSYLSAIFVVVVACRPALLVCGYYAVQLLAEC